MEKFKSLLAGVISAIAYVLTKTVNFLARIIPIRQKNRLFTIILIITAFLILVSLAFYAVSKTPSSTKNNLKVKDATSTQEINTEFNFPLRNELGEEAASFKYIIEKAELRDEIIVKGQIAKSVKGRTFLVLNLKIVNDFEQSVQIQTRDFLRLSVNGDRNQWLAPDIHNDPVDVQAISTKLTRVGFAINDSDKNLILRVGEINGEKKDLELKL